MKELIKSCSFCDKRRDEVKHLIERAAASGAVGGSPRICDECIGVALLELQAAGVTSFANGLATMTVRARLDRENARRLDSVSFQMQLAGSVEAPARFDEEKPPTPAASRYEPESEG